MQQTLIVGVDVSKSTLDICFKPSGVTIQISNETGGFKQWYKQLNSLCSTQQAVLVVMEHTGHYSFRFEKFLLSKGIGYCKIPALQIKRSLGVTRGKTDKVDAMRIADYGWLRRDILIADTGVQQDILQLEMLVSLRQKIVKDRSGYMNRLKMLKTTGVCASSNCIVKMQQDIIKSLTKQVKAIEAEIKSLISSNAQLANNYQLLTSIKGVGLIVAAYMISCTRNFTRFANFRKFNCYAGLAPFKHESGSSIKARSRVSHLANKRAKTLLNLAACCSIRRDQEMKQYYQKRIAEGKRKMDCLNIIRSKIVGRMFAIIKRQTPYQPLPITA
jgi:transposase